MLSPASLRICWVAAMAPALTEAATQANSFTLPTSPATESFSPLSISLRNGGKETKFCDISRSFVTLSQIGAGSDIYSPEPNRRYRIKESGLSLLPWADVKGKPGSHEHLTRTVRDDPCHRKNGTVATPRTPCRLQGILSLHGLKDQCPSVPSEQTMNENPSRVKDTMGLLNANTSLDCELKGKLADGSQPMEPEEKMFLLTTDATQLRTPNANSKRTDSEPGVLSRADQVKGFLLGDVAAFNVSHDYLGLSAKVRNVQLQQRAIHIFTKIRKLQARQVQSHIKGQLKSFVEHQQQNLGVPCQQRTFASNNVRVQNSEDLLHSEDVKNLSTAALVSLVRKLESSQHGRNYPHVDFHDKEKVEVKMSPAERQEIKQTVCKLHDSLTYLEREMDSDATESSSSDESGVEDDLAALASETSSPSCRKRVSWRWAVDRAAVASRWIWLQTQVADLEYKIRQQTEVYKHLRTQKGSVNFVDHSPGIVVDDHVVSGQSKNSISACFGTKVVNGFRPSESVGNGYGSAADRGEEGRTDSECIRVRPLKTFRKRKLVRTVGLHLTSRKTIRLSAVKCTCNCQRDLLPCVICGGRYNSVQTLDPDTMTFAERISLLDTSFHPVLSFRNDACLGIRYEKILRKCEFSKSAEKQGLLFRKRRYAISLADHARKHTRKLTKNAAQTLLSSAKLRKTLAVRHHRFARLNSKNSRKIYSRYADSLLSVRNRAERLRTSSVSSNGSSKRTSPASSPIPFLMGDMLELQEQNAYRSQSSASVGTLHELLRRRRFENAFDINNIVIPHSIASATRVEKLQYKEILTPKWRVFHEAGNVLVEETNAEEAEDLSDDTYAIRHQRCEEDEKRKFLSYVTKAGHGRSRLRSSRLDARADSSGANTPDPMSPYPADSSSNQEAPCGWNSPVASPPPTPNPAQEECSASLGSPAVVGRERRRTLSISKRASEDEHQFFVEEYFAVPYEPRAFPLSDDEYLEMLKNSPHLKDAIQCEAANMACEDAGVLVSRPQSPGNSSSVGSAPEEDPNDPEWTLMAGANRNRKPSIILKLAKR